MTTSRYGGITMDKMNSEYKQKAKFKYKIFATVILTTCICKNCTENIKQI